MLYLNFVSEQEKGVKKKIKSQIKALEKQDRKIKKGEIKENAFWIDQTKYFNYFLPSSKINRFIRQIQMIIILNKLKNKNIYEKIEIVYMRYIKSTIFTLNYFKFLKKIGVKLILEIPTYPYDNECKNKNIFSLIDNYYRKKNYKYVDKIVTYSEDEEIWGIPCINISNGIDLEEVKLVNKKEKNKDKIVFTSVSNCSFWHGIDRFLKSLKKYGKQKDKKEIIFNIIGEGAEFYNLKEIVSRSEYLSKIVKFQGFKMGKDLDDIYNKTDIGVGSLGIHRIGLKEVQPLKNREYTAKGIPFVISFIDPEFKDKNYVYKVEANEEIFDIEKLINWYENSKFSPNLIREDAKKFTWDIQMKKVLESI